LTPEGPGAAPRGRPTRTATRLQARGERTRAAIIAETVRCIEQEGYASASASHVAERAGVTWGVIQYHFGDRRGLLAAVVADSWERFRRAVEAVTVPDAGSRRRIESVVEAAWAAFSTPESLASLEVLVATRAARGDADRTDLETMGRGMHRLGAALVGDGSDGDVRAEVVGEVLWATLRGLAMSQMLSTRPIDTSAERLVLVELIRAYLDGTLPLGPGRAAPPG
jgi:AcrR family transcriptional regulator